MLQNDALPELQAAFLLSTGQVRQALEAASKGLNATPGNPELYNLAGICAAKLGQSFEAVQLWEHAIALAPHARAHFNLGLLHANNNRKDLAEKHYRLAIALQPGNAQAHYNLALLLAADHRASEAEACYRNAIAAHPAYAEAYTNLGALLAGQNRLEEAESYYRHALAAAPNHVAAHVNLGVLLARCNRVLEAEQHYRTALTLAPQNLAAHTNLGLLLEKSGRMRDAEQSHRAALALDPDHAEIHSNLANLLTGLRREHEAEGHYLLALSLKPGDATLNSNYGAMLSTLKRYDEAERYFLKALELEPEYAIAHLNLGQLLLTQGRYIGGWMHHEYRYAASLSDPIPFPVLPCPQWQGEPLAGKSLLVWPEQGFGDEIQFCRYLPLLRQQCAALTLVCKAPLKPLMETLEGVDKVLSMEEVNAAPGAQHDYWSFTLSLPLYCNTSMETIPHNIPYLHARPEYLDKWTLRLPRNKFRVGLVWKGNPFHSNDSERSLPRLETFAQLLALPGILFISLQKNNSEAAGCANLLHLGDELADFADTAAILAQLDLLISVDTSIVHLAGAMGKPCWVLLPAYKTDWRWMNSCSNSPWYPGLMRLFRQQKSSDWEPLIEEIRLALMELSA